MTATIFQTRQLSDNLILNTKLSDMVSQTIKGRNTAGTGDPEDLTGTQVRSIIGLSTTDNVVFGNLSGTNTGDNATNSLYSGLVTNANHTGDATGATALTLATVNSNVGTFGSTTLAPVITVNAKGLVTAVTTATITGGGGGVTKVVNVYTSSTTWTKPSGCKLVHLEILTPGQSGFSGGRQISGGVDSDYEGGRGGVAGSILRMVNLDASALASTETVTIGASSTPGAARTTTGNPNAPTNPGNSSFGVYRATFNTEVGAQLAGSLYAADRSGNGGSGVNSLSGLGGTGGTSSSGPGATPVTSLRFASSGGGGGGGATASTEENGGAGGIIATACGADPTGAFTNERFLNSNPAGGTTSGTRNGTAGSQVAGMYIGYGGGGGASSLTTNGGSGGAGGGYGSGGGGGGSCVTSSSFSSGAGGQGGAAIIIVISETW